MYHRLKLAAFSLTCVATICLTLPMTATAQTQSLFGDRGPASQIGSNLNGSIVGGSTTLGTQSGTGLNGQSIGGALGGTSAGNGALGTQGAFIGRDDTAGRFVGDQRLGQQNAGGGRGSTGRQFGNRGSGGGTGRAFGDTGQRGGRNSTRRIIRPRQKVAFTYRKPAVDQIRLSLTSRFGRIAAKRPALSGVTVTVNERGIATLTGQVDTPQSRKLAAIMVRL